MKRDLLSLISARQLLVSCCLFLLIATWGCTKEAAQSAPAQSGSSTAAAPPATSQPAHDSSRAAESFAAAKPSTPVQPAQTTDRSTSQQPAAQTATPPAAQPVAQKPATPATVKQVTEQLDLLTLPKLNESTLFESTPTSLAYEAKAKIGSTAAFYRAELADRGWKEIGNAAQPNQQYLDALFQKDGYYLKLTVSTSSDDNVSVRLVSLGNIDARTLPVPEGGESQGSGVPDQASYLYSSDVETVTTQLRDLLTKNGWRPYRPGESNQLPSMDYYVQNGVLLFTFVSSTPQYRNGQPVAGYSLLGAMPIDFPLMQDATDIQLVPMLYEFQYVTQSPAAETASFYKTAYQDLGWHVLQAQVEDADQGGSLLVEWNDDLRALITLTPRAEGGLLVALVRAPSARQLAELAAAEQEETTAPDQPLETPEAQPDTSTDEDDESAPQIPDIGALLRNELEKNVGDDADAADLARRALDDVLGRIDGESDGDDSETADADEQPAPLGEAMQADEFPLPDGASDIQRLAERRRITFRAVGDGDSLADFFDGALSSSDWHRSLTISRPGVSGTTTELSFDREGRTIKIKIETTVDEHLATVTVSGNGLQFGDQPPAEGSAEEMEAEERDGFPIPTNNTSYSSLRSKYRSKIEVQVPASLEKVVEFYNRELADRGWKAVESAATVTPDQAVLSFTREGQQLQLTARAAGEETAVEATSRDAAAAKKDGILPQEGKARLLIGNASNQEVTIAINGRPYKVKAGVGVDDPTKAMSLNVGPGKYTFALPGAGGQPEAVTLAEGETWGIIVLDNGAVFSDAVY